MYYGTIRVGAGVGLREEVINRTRVACFQTQIITLFCLCIICGYEYDMSEE